MLEICKSCLKSQNIENRGSLFEYLFAREERKIQTTSQAKGSAGGSGSRIPLPAWQ